MQIDLRQIPVIYINLDKDIEKKEKIEKQLNDAGFTNVIRFAGYEIDTPKLGCATSHNDLLGIISKYNMPVLVLEDDVVMTKSFNPIIDVPKDADAIYLGISKYGLYNGHGQKKISAERYDDNLYRIYNMLGAHAILYMNKAYPKFLKQATSFMMDIEDNQDKARATTMKFFKVYGFDYPMFFQNNYHKIATKFRISEYHGTKGKRHAL